MAFIDALAATYGLKDVRPEELRWADVKSTTSIYLPPRFQVSIADRLPAFATALVALDGDNVVSSPHYAPLFFRDVAPLSMSEDLRKYVITKKRGVLKEQDEVLKEPETLETLIGKFRSQGYNLPTTTNVVEMLSVLPIAPNGEFKTEFYPTVDIPLSRGDFSFPHIVQDERMYAALISSLGKLDLLDLRQDNTTHRFKAEYVPTMDSIERLFVPDSAGHMVVLALPVNVKRDYGEIFSMGNEYGFGSGMMRGGGYTLGTTRSAEIGRLNIGKGSKTDVKTREADVSPDPSRVGAIYHIVFIGMKPDSHIDATHLSKVGKALDHYQKSGN